MPYALVNDRGSARQSYLSFRASSKISERTDSPSYARKIMRAGYRKAIRQSIQNGAVSNTIAMLPPAKDLWSWSDSLEIIMQEARKAHDITVNVLIPNNARFGISAIQINEVDVPPQVEHITPEDVLTQSESDISDSIADLLNPVSSSAEDDFVLSDDGTIKELHKSVENDDRSVGKNWLNGFGGLSGETWDSASSNNDVVRDDRKFVERVKELMEAEKIGANALCNRANLSRQFVDALLNMDKKYDITKRESVAIACALRISFDDVNEFLDLCGHALTSEFKFDIICSYYIGKKIYSIDEINKALFCYNQDIMGSAR